MLPFSSSSSLYSYFSSHHHHDYIWRGGAHSLAERVSIKGGSTMRKMRGSKGPSGRRAAGLNAGVLGHMVCVCVTLISRPLKCGRALPSLTVVVLLLLLSVLLLLLSGAHRNTCSSSLALAAPSHPPTPRACWRLRTFQVRGHRLLLSHKQSGTRGCCRDPGAPPPTS